MLSELFYKIALSHQKGYGNSTIKKLLQLSGSATKLFNDFAVIRKSAQKSASFPHPPKITPEIEKRVNDELAFSEKYNFQFCFIDEDEYPKRLAICKDAPYMFTYKGEPNFNKEKSLAIVGTRFSSSYGKDVVRKIINELSPYNVSIISGLAKGIDTIAHEAALEFDLQTIGVMGAGFGNIYPSCNRKLVSAMIEQGSIVMSEFPYLTLPERQNFPKRNRIIAGMADAVLVAETGKRGGSIITACIAHSYQRDVFAIPGSIFEPAQEGCNELIRQNLAALVTSGQDIIEMMGWNTEITQDAQPKLFHQLTSEEEIIFEVLHKLQNPTIDELTATVNIYSSSKIAAILLGLELNGVIECLPGKRYRLRQR